MQTIISERAARRLAARRGLRLRKSREPAWRGCYNLEDENGAPVLPTHGYRNPCVHELPTVVSWLRDTTGPMLLTSQYARGVKGAEEAALDGDGGDWYRDQKNVGYYLSLDDEDVPEWPVCVSCGAEVDWLHEAHWHSARDGYFLHDCPACVRLVYPALQE